ncbi:MAG TPA: A24 family peptidase [Pirellulaceae bacterium]|nr:A24 family peptidase [Pirellulaceae bacterium]
MTPLVLLLLLLLAASICDLRRREIPDWVPLAMLAWAAAAAAAGIGGATWLGAACGFAVGLALSAPLFYLGGIGGGDVKLIAALGAALGPWPLAACLLWIAIFGGILAGIASLRGQKDFAYAPAMFLGLAAFALRSLEWSHV